jgi:hypothetical protein
MAYNRFAAVMCAGILFDRVALDGRVATKQGYPTKINGVTLKPGMPFRDIGAINGEFDCAHFISCCVGDFPGTINFGGTPMQLRGGGLRISQAVKGVYGQTHVAHLAAALLANGGRFVGRAFWPTHDPNTRAAILKELVVGDVLTYLTKDSVNHYEHAAILVGPGLIACHTKSRLNADYALARFPWVRLIKLP